MPLRPLNSDDKPNFDLTYYNLEDLEGVPQPTLLAVGFSYATIDPQ